MDPDTPTFVPVVVSVAATASDTDTYWYMWLPFDFWAYMNILDLLASSELTGPSGFPLTQATLGNASGQFSTVDCANQTETMVEKAFQWEVDDLPQIENDDPVNLFKSIYVVLPNAAQTALVGHIRSGITHIGDAVNETVFFQPSDVSPTNPAPSVSFSHFTIEEGNWELLYVDETDGLENYEVRDWFESSNSDWDSTWVLTGNSFSNGEMDGHAINRWGLASQYGESFKNPGLIVIKQGYRVVEPLVGPWWYHQVEFHFVGEATRASDPGHCHIHKQTYLTTSMNKPAVFSPECEN